MLFPLSYCFPDDLFVNEVPEKEKIFANYLPGAKYSFTDSNEYLKEYRQSIFGVTSKKCGWDCYRHLEIMSQGCFPYFQDIELIPKNTMMHYPKDFMKEMMLKYSTKSFLNIKKNSMSGLKSDIANMLKITKDNLSGTAMIKYILNLSKKQDSKKILYTNSWSGYIGHNLTIAGKKIYGKNFVDRYPTDYLYSDYPQEKIKDQYGYGFNYTRLIDPSLRSVLSEDEIKEQISSRDFDCIFYGSCMEKKIEDIDFIKNYYEPEEIIYICEFDCSPLNDPDVGWTVYDNHYCNIRFPIDNKSYFFMREIGN